MKRSDGYNYYFFKLKDRSKIIFFLWTSYVLEKENDKKKNCNWVNFFTFLFVSFIEVGIDLKKKNYAHLLSK